MQARRRMLVVALSAALLATFSGSAFASDRAAEPDPAETNVVVDRVDKETDRPAEQPKVRPVDEPIDARPDRPSDTPSDRPSDKPADRPSDKQTDRPSDKPSDRCRQHQIDRRCVDVRPDHEIDRCLAVAENDRRCVRDHDHDDINIRRLIWRLINAHEWEKLIRLFHWLGWL